MRVMVVDDSALYRKVISDVIAEETNLQVVGTAPNGRIALMKIPDQSPDLIVLDMEMPEMDGLTTLRELARQHPNVKAIVFSHHTEIGAELTLKALNLGAVDFVTKPVSGGAMEQSIRNIKESLIPKLTEFAGHAVQNLERPAPSNKGNPVSAAIRKRLSSPIGPRDVIAIGISTGGPSTLVTLFEQIPHSLPQAILIVQHMPAIFTRKLAEQLTRVGSIPVWEAQAGQAVERGNAYIAPGDFHMEVNDANGLKKLRIFKGPQENYCRPAVDVLFRSVARVYGQRAVGVIMTGMGKDGFAGCEVMKEAGAPIVAQDELSSVVWGMPRFVVEGGLADRVSPLHDMYNSIKDYIL